MRTEVLYLSWNRNEFVQETFPRLLTNTDWSQVSKLVAYDDGSEDGALEFLAEAIKACPVEFELRETDHVGPVEIMNRFVEATKCDWFLKSDSDILLPPGYLEALVQVRDDVPYLEAIGMEAGRTVLPPHPRMPEAFRYGYTPARHIGGVGLIRTEVLGRRPLMVANGRFGWTEMQEQWNVSSAWINPDLYCPQMDRLPFEPWLTLSAEYVEKGWSRPWGAYHPRWMCRYWAEAFPDWEEILAGPA